MTIDISDFSEGLQLYIKRNHLNALEIKALRAAILKMGEELGADPCQPVKDQADNEYSETTTNAQNVFQEKLAAAKSIWADTVKPYKEAYNKSEFEARALKEAAIASAMKEYEDTIESFKKEYDTAEALAKQAYEDAHNAAVREYNDIVEKAKADRRTSLSRLRKEEDAKGFRLIKIRSARHVQAPQG